MRWWVWGMVLSSCAGCADGSLEFTRRGDGVAVDPALQAVVEAAAAGDVGALVAHLGDADPRVRARAAFEAARTSPAVAAPPPELAGAVRAAVRDPDSRVRSDAVFALSIWPPDPDREAVLVERLAVEGDDEVRRGLLTALGRVGGVDASSVVAADALIRTGTEALARMAARGALDRGARDSLLARLAHTDPTVRGAAARGLAASGDPDLWIAHRATLRSALEASAGTEATAWYLLDGFGRLLPRTELMEWMSPDRGPRARMAAVRALATHSDGVVGIAALSRALEDPHPWVRTAAAMGLAGFGARPSAVEALAGVVGSETDPTTEDAWLRALADAGRFDELADRVRSRSPHDGAAWRAVAGVTPGLPEPLRAEFLTLAAGADDPQVRRWAEALLGIEAPSPPVDAGSSVPPWTADDWAALAALGPRPRMVVDFDAGRVVVALDPDQAPAAILDLSRRAEAGAYDGVPVHRVLPGALIQWGDPGLVEGVPGPEPGRIPFRRGAVGRAAAAGSGDDDLFVVFDDLREFDGVYSAVGWVERGLTVLESLSVGATIRALRIEPG